MSDSVTITNMPSSGTREAVALELFRIVLHHVKDRTLEKELDLYKACLNTVWRSNYDISKLT